MNQGPVPKWCCLRRVNWAVFLRVPQWALKGPQEEWTKYLLYIGRRCVYRGFKLLPNKMALVVMQSLSHIRLFETPWTAAHQASLSFTISRSFLKLMSIESMMPSNHLTLCCPLLCLPSIFPSIRVFFNELALCIRWPKYWSFSFSISPFNEYSGLISFRIDGLDFLTVPSKFLLHDVYDLDEQS